MVSSKKNAKGIKGKLIFGSPIARNLHLGEAVFAKHLCRSHRTVPALGAVDGDAFQVGMFNLVPPRRMAYPTNCR